MPKPATATRSEGARRSMNALAALAIASAPPNLMFGWSMAMTIRRPPVALSLVLYPSGGNATVAPAGSAARGIHSAVTTRRVLPSTRTTKSAGVRLATGLPRSSTTVTSSEVTSTDV